MIRKIDAGEDLLWDKFAITCRDEIFPKINRASIKFQEFSTALRIVADRTDPMTLAAIIEEGNVVTVKKKQDKFLKAVYRDANEMRKLIRKIRRDPGKFSKAAALRKELAKCKFEDPREKYRRTYKKLSIAQMVDGWLEAEELTRFACEGLEWETVAAKMRLRYTKMELKRFKETYLDTP
jgi:hypothetical protein